MLKERLCQINLTGNEADVYLELLKIGPQPASVIAKRVNLNRTTTYSILKTLAKKAIISSSGKGGTQVFFPNDPNCLVAYADKQCATMQYYRSEIVEAVPLFREIKGNCVFSKPIVAHFEGIHGVKHVLEDLASARGAVEMCCPADLWLDESFSDFLNVLKKLRARSGEKTRIIAPNLPELRFRSKEMSEEILFVDNFDSIFGAHWNIYDNKVCSVSLKKGDEYAIMIEDLNFASMQKSLFGLVWKAFRR